MRRGRTSERTGKMRPALWQGNAQRARSGCRQSSSHPLAHGRGTTW